MVLEAVRALPCTTDLFQSAKGLWWVLVYPEGISLNLPMSGPPRLDTTAQLDETAALLYEHLAEQRAELLAAIAGWEVAELFLPEGASGYRDLRLETAPFSQAGWDGLVIPIATWVALGEPVSFQPFRPGYVWRPYQSLGISGW